MGPLAKWSHITISAGSIIHIKCFDLEKSVARQLPRSVVMVKDMKLDWMCASVHVHFFLACGLNSESGHCKHTA